jgi:hypothetical protein
MHASHSAYSSPTAGSGCSQQHQTRFQHLRPTYACQHTGHLPHDWLRQEQKRQQATKWLASSSSSNKDGSTCRATAMYGVLTCRQMSQQCARKWGCQERLLLHWLQQLLLGRCLPTLACCFHRYVMLLLLLLLLL